MILVDTSVWIEFFRARDPIDLARYADIDEVVTCLPVIQDVLQGFRDERAFMHARDAMLALPIVESPLDQELYLEAAALYRTARRVGVTVRPSVDGDHGHPARFIASMSGPLNLAFGSAACNARARAMRSAGSIRSGR